MTISPDGQYVTFDEMEEMVYSFEESLKELGITITSDSPLEAACLDAIRIVELHAKPELRDEGEDIRERMRPLLGLWTLISKTLRLKEKNGFEQFTDHYRLLNDGVVWQNGRYLVGDTAADKIFELMFGLAVFEVADSIELDDPNNAKGDNPDVLAEIEGVTWGFACKAPRSENPRTLFDNLSKAIDQIEKSRAQIGIPVVNLKDSLPHESVIWPLINYDEWAHDGKDARYFVWTDPSELFRRLRDYATSIRIRVESEIGLVNVLGEFQGKKSLPAFLGYMQTVSGIQRSGQPVACDIRDLSIQEFMPIRDSDVAVMNLIHKAFHDRLHIELRAEDNGKDAKKEI